MNDVQQSAFVLRAAPGGVLKVSESWFHRSIVQLHLARASAQELTPGEFRRQFDPKADLVKEIAAVIDAEHRCRRFLRFLLLVEPGDGPVWLAVTGPVGTGDFLSTLLDTPPGISNGR